MHLRKISAMVLASMIVMSSVPSVSLASENKNISEIVDINEYPEIENMDANKLLILPESKEERIKIMVDEKEELEKEAQEYIEEGKVRASLMKPEFRRTIYSNDMLVSGVTTPNTKVLLSLNIDGYREYFKLESDSEGFFGMLVPMGYLEEGMVILAYSYKGSNKSEVAKTTVAEAPMNAPSVGTVTSYSDYVEGYANDFHDEAFVEINGKVYTCGSVGDVGEFAIPIPRQKAGTKISVYTKNRKGVKSPVCNKIVEKGFTFSKLPKNITNKTTSITGTTVPYAEVELVVCGEIKTVYADKAGNFKIRLTSSELKRSSSVEIIAHDINSGISSEKVSIPVLKAPSVPKVNNSRITESTTKISGTAKAGYTAYVKIGSNYYKSKVASDGKFTVTIPKQKKGTRVLVYVKGTNGANSSYVQFKVTKTSKSPIEPVLKTVVGTSTTSVSGTGTPGCTASIRVGNKYYRSTVAKDGSFKIKIPKLKKGTAIKVYQKNSKGEYSSILTKKVVQSPKAPKSLMTYNEDGKGYIYGEAQDGCVVYAKIGNKYYKSEGVDRWGEFEIEVPKFKKGTVIKLFAKNIDTGANSSVVTIKALS